jgi:hypothetical protein
VATFLQILLAVVLVLAVCVAAGFWWLKRRLEQTVEGYTAALELIDAKELRPARLQLHRSDVDALGPALVALLHECRSLGFRPMANFEDHAGGIPLLCAARHRELPIAAALVESSDDEVGFVLFTVDQDKRVFALGNGPGIAVRASSLEWQVTPELSLTLAFDAVRPRALETNLPVDLRLFRAVFEQAYAAGMDQKIVHPPKRESVERKASQCMPPPSEAQVEQAYQMLQDHWYEQLEQAVLDRYRRNSKIDAVTWEDLRERIDVVHEHLDDGAIEALLVDDEVGEQIFSQYQKQGLSGIGLYEAVSARLPANQRRSKLGEVNIPVRARLFTPDEEASCESPTAGRYVYEAEDADGNVAQGGLFAKDARDAKQQLASLGMQDAKLLMESSTGYDLPSELIVDEKSARLAAKAVREGVAMSVLRAILSNWWIWAPPAVLLTMTIRDSAPFDWSDYAVFGYAALAVSALVFLIAPMVLYNQVLLGYVKGRFRYANTCLSVLRVLNRVGLIDDHLLTLEQCKNLAADGAVGEAFDIWHSLQNELCEDLYLSGQVQICDAAGDWPAMIEAQRAYLDETSAKETAAIDLAMSIARFGDDLPAAESLIQSVSPTDLPEVGVIGYQFARGLVAAKRRQYTQALRHYGQAIESSRQFASNPIMLGLVAEISGYAALAHKLIGQTDRAQHLWQQAWPILGKHRSGMRLIADYEAA